MPETRVCSTTTSNTSRPLTPSPTYIRFNPIVASIPIPLKLAVGYSTEKCNQPPPKFITVIMTPGCVCNTAPVAVLKITSGTPAMFSSLKHTSRPPLGLILALILAGPATRLIWDVFHTLCVPFNRSSVSEYALFPPNGSAAPPAITTRNFQFRRMLGEEGGGIAEVRDAWHQGGVAHQ